MDLGMLYPNVIGITHNYLLVLSDQRYDLYYVLIEHQTNAFFVRYQEDRIRGLSLLPNLITYITTRQHLDSKDRAIGKKSHIEVCCENKDIVFIVFGFLSRLF